MMMTGRDGPMDMDMDMDRYGYGCGNEMGMAGWVGVCWGLGLVLGTKNWNN